MKFKSFILVCSLLFGSTQVQAAQDVIIPSAAYTASQNSADIVRYKESAAHFIIVISAVPGAQTLTPTIQGKDALGNYYTLLVGNAISTTGTTVLKVGNSLGSIPNGSATDLIPDIYRVQITASGGGSFTYSVTLNRGE